MKTRLSRLRGLILAAALPAGLGTARAQFQPVNDMFANRTVITGTNISVTGLTLGATKEPGEPDHAGNSGGASIWWSWQAPADGTATISTAGSTFDTLLGVYTGTSVSELTTVASDDDDPDTGALTSKVTFTAAANQTYQIAVDGYDGDYGLVMLSVVLGPATPAPAWVAPDIYGVSVNSSNYAGKVVILDFWATWCPDCQAGLPDLVALQDKYGADGLVIVGADGYFGGDTASGIQSFLATWTPAINYEMVMAGWTMVQDYGGVPYIPDTFIIDRQNCIQKEYVGTQPISTLENEIIPLLYGNTMIACGRSGNQLTLCWPNTAVPFTLQSATNLARPDWSDWPVAPSLVNGANTVQVPMTGPPGYFRLRMTY